MGVYLSHYGGMVVLGTVVPSIFTALLLQTGEEDLWTRSKCGQVVDQFQTSKCRQVLHLVQHVPATTAPLWLLCHLLTRKPKMIDFCQSFI